MLKVLLRRTAIILVYPLGILYSLFGPLGNFLYHTIVGLLIIPLEMVDWSIKWTKQIGRYW